MLSEPTACNHASIVYAVVALALDVLNQLHAVTDKLLLHIVRQAKLLG